MVERAGVTISGTAAGGATIDPPDGADGVPEGPAIYALGAHELALEDLTLTGGLNGLEAIASRKMRLTGVRALFNPGRTEFVDGYGVKLDASEASVAGSELSANGSAMLGTGGPIIAINASQADVTGTTMADNPWDGPFSVYNSSLVVTASTIANNGLGPQALYNSRTTVTGSSVTDNGEYGEFATQHSILRYVDSTIRNPGWTEASFSSRLYLLRSSLQTSTMFITQSSNLELVGSTVWGLCLEPECDPDEFLYMSVENHSFAEARRVFGTTQESNIRGRVLLAAFSDARFLTGEPISGDIECLWQSRVEVDPPPAGGVRGCE